jgi:hypothetical protein
LQAQIKKNGAEGVISKQRGGNRGFCCTYKEKVMQRIHDRYSDFGPSFACEKLRGDGFKINKETLRQWMMEAGLWKGKRRKKFSLHQSRERRACFGELVQIDGSYHDWFEGRREKCCLLVSIDDATSRLIALRFEEAETTLGYMRMVHDHIILHGRPICYYSDRHSIFKTSRENKIDGKYPDTQFARALRNLSIHLICANSPEAKGRVERSNKTLQDRLIKEMRLLGISTIEDANKWLPSFIEDYNKRFAKPPLNPTDAHRVNLHDAESLQRILSIQETRKLSKALEFSFEGDSFQVTTPNVVNRLRHKEIIVCKRMDGSLCVNYEQMPLTVKTLKTRSSVQIVGSKEFNNVIDLFVSQLSNERHSANYLGGYLNVSSSP